MSNLSQIFPCEHGDLCELVTHFYKAIILSLLCECEKFSILFLIIFLIVLKKLLTLGKVDIRRNI